MNEQELAGSNGKSLVWVEYRVAGRTFASATGAQFYYGWRTLWGLRPALAEVRLLHSSCLPDCDAARARLGLLLTSLGGSV